MIPFLIFGALMTQMLPITTNMSLEDVPYKKVEADEVGGVGGGVGVGESEERRKSRLDRDAKSVEREARLVNDA